MSVTNPLSSPDRSVEHRALDPSMEEILASIRRIIADDQADDLPELEPAPAADPAGAESVAALEEQLAAHRAATITEAAIPPDAAVPPAAAATSEADPSSVEPSAAPAAPSAEIFGLHALRPAVAPQPEPEPAPLPLPASPEPEVPEVQPLPVAPAAQRLEPPSPAPEEPLLSAEADASVASSFHALLASHFLQNSGMIADMTREMLRPMLKGWLDDNLPVIVERLVRAEIERVARSAR